MKYRKNFKLIYSLNMNSSAKNDFCYTHMIVKTICLTTKIQYIRPNILFDNQLIVFKFCKYILLY